MRRKLLFVFRVWETILLYDLLAHTIITPLQCHRTKPAVNNSSRSSFNCNPDGSTSTIVCMVSLYDTSTLISYILESITNLHISQHATFFFLVWRLRKRMKMASHAYLYSLNWKMPTRWVAHVCIDIVTLLDNLMHLLMNKTGSITSSRNGWRQNRRLWSSWTWLTPSC